MIIQGSNDSLIFLFDENYFEGSIGIEVSLFTEKEELKHWSIDDIIINDTKLECPLTQEETVNFPYGDVYIEVKFMDADGFVGFFPIMKDKVVKRYDKTII